jgi:hypothetical protein
MLALAAMNWFNILEGSRRSASGLEWEIWRKLPLVFLAGTLLPVLIWAAFELLSPQSRMGQSIWVSTGAFVTLGAVIFNWTMVLTVAIGCGIVIVMKGPGYVADAYSLSHSDQPLSDSLEVT